MLLVGPHLDDIPASAAHVLFSARRPTALTVCAGWRPGPVAWWDERCGFESAEQAATARRAEDRAALAGLDVDVVHLDYVDGQYPRPPDDGQRLEAELGDRFAAFDRILVCAGIGGHVDHLWVRDTALRARRPSQPVWVYGDYGYLVTQDWEESSRLSAHGVLPAHFESLALSPQDAARKRAMIDAYRSQRPAFTTGPDLLAPHIVAVEWYAEVPEPGTPAQPFPRPYRESPPT